MDDQPILLLARVAALAIFAATYLVVALGRLPGFRIDRAGAALLGGALMVATGVLSLEEAYRAIDLDTVALLLGTMIVIAHLKLSGVFALATAWVARHVRGPMTTLVLIVLLAGVASAFLVNDTICLALTPLVLELVARQGRQPAPYLLAVALASNIGSTATITGNPQNIMIGSFSHIRYADFTAVLAPVSLIGLAVATVLIVVLHRRAFAGAARSLATARLDTRRIHAPLARKAALVTAAMIVAFFVIHPPAEVALVAGAALLLTRRIKPERIYREIDWPLLVMFVGLFVVVAGLRKVALTPDVLAYARALPLEQIPILTLVAAALSNLVSNVPAVLVLKPFIEQLADPRTAWLTLAMASTLAGNFTVVGSVANLIVVQRARRHGVEISFWAYFKIGAPVTLLTLTLGAGWLMLTR